MLGIAFGARGMGGKATAHYEPYFKIINLTRDSGNTAFAHEFGHSLDYIFGTYIDQNKKYSALSGGGSVAIRLADNKGGKIRQYANEIIDKYKTYRKTNPIMFESEYYQRRNEIFARMFEQYIALRKKELGIKDNFISLSYESYIKAKHYMPDKEFQKLRPLFYKLINEFSKKMNS
ncbi:MAG: LPD1 domain-containing protein, partial [Bacteroidales bacterium]